MKITVQVAVPAVVQAAVPAVVQVQVDDTVFNSLFYSLILRMLRCSSMMHRFMTTAKPASRALEAASL